MSTGQLRTARSLAAAAKLEKLDVLTPAVEAVHPRTGSTSALLKTIQIYRGRIFRNRRR